MCRAKEEHASADAARLQQVLWNVLKNAVKFTPQGGFISLIANNFEENSKKFLRIDIRDSGIGISEKLLPRIFETFEQGGEDVTSKFGGLGKLVNKSQTLYFSPIFFLVNASQTWKNFLLRFFN